MNPVMLTGYFRKGGKPAMEVKKRIPAFVYKLNPGQFGNGIYAMAACFPILGVHVHFTFEAHSENDYLRDVSEAIPCDGSCKHYSGRMENFAEKRDSTDYSVTRIVEKAKAYANRQSGLEQPSA